jgi:Flp pilus assembly protein TadB
VVDVYLSRPAALVRLLVWSVAMTAWLEVAHAIDLFGWYDDEDQATSLSRFVVGVIVFLLVGVAFQYPRIRKEREAVGPRFDTDREALRQALVHRELPADESLDEALLTAVVRRRRDQTVGDGIAGRVVVAILAVGFVGALALSEAPWSALVAVVLVVVGVVATRRRQEPRQLADLESDLRARLGTQPPSGGLTRADLQG